MARITKDGKQMAEKMLRRYGTTQDVLRTAFVLPGGERITYRGTAEIHHSGMARDVGATGVTDFLCQTGAIKLHHWGNENIIHACSRPTSAQKRVIAKMVRPRRLGSRPVPVMVEADKSIDQYGGSCYLTESAVTIDRVVACLRKHADKLHGWPPKPPGSGRPPPAIRFFGSARRFKSPSKAAIKRVADRMGIPGKVRISDRWYDFYFDVTPSKKVPLKKLEALAVRLRKQGYDAKAGATAAHQYVVVRSV
jgi:hypothetical protein